MENELIPARRFLSRLEGKRFLAAVSGGLDSMCLLHFLAGWCEHNEGMVIAAHFNHCLREGTADRDEMFVRDWCAAHHIPFVAGRGDVRSFARREGFTVEEAARRLRYDFLQRTASKQNCDWILTAHHADDNAETMLFNLIRGTGSRGLCGIPAVRDNIARPFLDLTREGLAAYAAAHQLSHVEDETNHDPDAASRNLLRLKVMPLLRELNPRAVEHMSHAAAILERENAALSAMAHTLVTRTVRAADGLRISRAVLAEAPAAVAERGVLKLLSEAGGSRLSATDVETVLTLAKGPSGREARLSDHLLVRAEGTELVISRLPAPQKDVPIALGETASFGSWAVTLEREPVPGAMTYMAALPDDAPLSVTHWRPKDRMMLPGAKGARSLKRLFADFGLRPWQRDALPVLRADGEPAAVPFIGTGTRFLPLPSEKAWFISFYQLTIGRG